MGDTRSGKHRGGPRTVGAAAARAVLLAMALTMAPAGCGQDQGPEATLPGAVYDPPPPAPALRLADGAGGRYDLSDDRGRLVLVFFGFTTCPDVCPATLDRWARVRAALGPDASRVRFLFVSIDSERDTPALAAAYAAGFDSTFVGVSGTEGEIGETALAWGVAVSRAPEGGPGAEYDLVHASQVFVVDHEGLLRWGYGRSATVEEITKGIRSLLPGRP